MKSVRGISALSVLVLVAAVCSSCDKAEWAATETVGKPAGIVAATAEDPNIVAEIGDYSITRAELIEKLISELRPDRSVPVRHLRRPSAEEVLLKMAAEKMMALEGRKLNYLQDPGIQRQMKRFREQRLSNLTLSRRFKNRMIAVTAAELEQKLQDNPKLERQRAIVLIKREKTFALVDELYAQLSEKFHLVKSAENLSNGARIYQRLLENSKSPYSIKFVGLKQIQEELTDQEKNTVLATYDGGAVTLKDWFDVLHGVGPASRPKDLNTPQGFERFLDRAVLKKPILIAEAAASGLDNDPNLLKLIRQREDMLLANKVKLENAGDVNQPTDEEVIAYFNEHREDFMKPPDTLKIDQIWCRDLDTARKVRAEIDSGGSFESLRGQYSLEKQAGPVSVGPGTEGVFFDDLWGGEPDRIAGPLRGLYGGELAWRIVKIVEKTPGQPRQYSADLDEGIKSRIFVQRRQARQAEYQERILEKYPHRIYPERFTELLDFP